MGGPATSTSSTVQTRAPPAPTASAMPGGPRHAEHAGAVGRCAARDRRALRPEPHHVLAVEQHPHRPAVLVGEAVARGGPRRCSTLPPKAPPLASGVAGSPPGAHHDASGSRYAGSTQRVRSVAAQSPARQLERRAGVDGGAPALHLAGGGAGLGQRLADRPPARAVGHGDERVRRARCRRRSRPAESDRRGHPLGGASLDAPPGWRGGVEVAVGRHRPSAPMARRPRRRGSSASRCSGRGGRAAPARPPAWSASGALGCAGPRAGR